MRLEPVPSCNRDPGGVYHSLYKSEAYKKEKTERAAPTEFNLKFWFRLKPGAIPHAV